MNYINKYGIAFLFIAPAITVLFFFFFVPVFAAFVMSFTDFDIYALADFKNILFIGFKNYQNLITDPLFWTALKNTLYFVVIGGPLSVIVSLSVAILVNSKVAKFKTFFRTIFFIPVVTTIVAVSVVWKYLYHPRFGLINYILNYFSIEPIDWLGNSDYAMPAIIIMAIWKNFGYNMIIFVAGLQSIPEQLYEAAKIDGANEWQKFYNITMPMLSQTTIFVCIITMIGYFQLFSEPYVMTQGGPLNSTLSIVLLMYQHGFKWWSMGYSVSIAFMLFVIIYAVTLFQLKWQKKKEI
ncbi:MAG: sugar ABC transporter permease [Bacteroidota bacterium]